MAPTQRGPNGRIIEVGQPAGFLAHLGIENTQERSASAGSNEPGL
ncbi:MAG TPA: hypothetical protein VG348_06295 [Acidimicrobiia bacterium]|nr:hypothetical protein [Acidimicrobiia bacterium]